MDVFGIGTGEALSQRDLAKTEQFYAFVCTTQPLSLGGLCLGNASVSYHLDHLDI